MIEANESPPFYPYRVSLEIHMLETSRILVFF